MSCICNCLAETSSVNWSTWIQTGIAATSVLVAAWIPTKVFRHEQQKALTRERARARCTFALSVELLDRQLLELFEIGFQIAISDRSEDILRKALSKTEVLKEIRDALSVGHEFPSLADALVLYALRLNDAHSQAQSTLKYGMTSWIEGKDPYELGKKIEAAVESGMSLSHSLSGIMDV